MSASSRRRLSTSLYGGKKLTHLIGNKLQIYRRYLESQVIVSSNTWRTEQMQPRVRRTYLCARVALGYLPAKPTNTLVSDYSCTLQISSLPTLGCRRYPPQHLFVCTQFVSLKINQKPGDYCSQEVWMIFPLQSL